MNEFLCNMYNAILNNMLGILLIIWVPLFSEEKDQWTTVFCGGSPVKWLVGNTFKNGISTLKKDAAKNVKNVLPLSFSPNDHRKYSGMVGS